MRQVALRILKNQYQFKAIHGESSMFRIINAGFIIHGHSIQTRPNANHGTPFPVRSLLWITAIVVLMWPALVSAQTQQSSGPTDNGKKSGFLAGFPLNGLDSVNLYNGRVSFTLPIATIGARGGASYQPTVSISRTFVMRSFKNWSFAGSHWMEPVYRTISEGYSDSMDFSNFRAGLLPAVIIGRRTRDNHPSPEIPFLGNPCRTLTKLHVRMAGREIELRDVMTNGEPHFDDTGTLSFNRGHQFHAVDGSGTLFISDSPIADETCTDNGWAAMNGNNVLFPSGILMMKDGTRYRFVEGQPKWMRDRNGNTLRFPSPGEAIDSIGRRTVLNGGVTYKDQNGNDQTVSVIMGSLTTALRSDLVAAGVTVKSEQQLFPMITLQTPTALFDPQVIKAIRLPNGLEYSFFYNEYGELAKIVLPSGWSITYEHAGGPGPSTGGSIDSQIYRVATEKGIWDEFGTRQFRQTYEHGGGAKVTTYNSSNAVISVENHLYRGDPRSDFQSTAWYQSFDNGQELTVEMLDSTGQNVLRRVENVWKTLDLAGNPTTPPVGTFTHPTNYDCALTEVKTTILDTNQVSRVTFSYDGNGNKTDVYEYDFGLPNSGPGSIIRRSHFDYNQDNMYVSTSGPYILNLLTRTWISSDVSGTNKLVQTDYEYDNYITDALHAGLLDRVNIAGLCLKLNDEGTSCLENSITSYATRGNLTQVTSYHDIQANGFVRTAAQYDIAGNVIKTIDARGKPTTISFADAFGVADDEARSNTPPSLLNGQSAFAFATATTNALGHTAFAQYNYHRGMTVNEESKNGVVNTMHYNDLLGRQTQLIVASNIPELKRQTTFIYDDVARSVTTKNDLKTFNDNLLMSRTILDGLGRTKEAREYESPTVFITTLTEYEGLDRVKRVSNPFRPDAQPPESPIWTTTEYDLLGRVKKVTTVDGAHSDTDYTGVQTLVTDQAGKQRMTETDAAGRLRKVWEIRPQDADTVAVTLPGNQPAHGYLTTYDYDAVGNLVKVSQGQQQRFFAYDSLSRMVRTSNPEQGAFTPTTDFPALTHPLTGNSQWSNGYLYDENGALKKQIDPRGVVRQFSYDDLGRLTSKTFTDGTPSVSYGYDSPSVFHSVGRLTSVTSTVSGYFYNDYDQLGRIKACSQVVDTQTYTMSYTYDLAGNIKSQTYPSGRVVGSEYDDNGRIAGVKNQSNGLYYAGAVVTDSANRIQYWAHGAVKDMKLGNGLWEHSIFNSRLHPTQIGLGTTQGSVDRLKLNYDYGTTNNNGNVLSQVITVPTIGSASGFTATQNYTYDQLNRLETAQENNGSSWKQKFLYDRYGNRRIDSNEVNTSPDLIGPNPNFSGANNRILVQAGEQYDYDSAGNLIRGREGQSYVFDAENKMVSFNGGSSQGGASYSYDGDGKRVKKVFGNVTTVFVYDINGRLIAEYSSAPPEPNGTRYLTGDHLGSPRVITDTSGTVKARHDYHPFGEEIGLRGGRNADLHKYVVDTVKQKFTSKERDDETGLDYFGARYYASTLGRFTSPDPLHSSGRPIYPQSWNRYSYVINHPLSLVDPNGLDWGMARWFDKDKQEWVIDFHYFTGAVGEWNGHTYTAVNFGTDATVTMQLSDGRTVAISNDPDALGGAYMRDITPRSQPEQAPVLAPCWVDYVPVLSTARKFLFHYTTHNFEAAILDFSVMSVELGTANVASSAGVAKSFATKPGEAIFFSGKGSFQVATQTAKSEGGKLITDTFGGKALNVLTKPLPERVADPFWKWGSKHFAEGASGSVRAVLREPMRNNSTWRQVEYPILRNNPFVRLTQQ